MKKKLTIIACLCIAACAFAVACCRKKPSVKEPEIKVSFIEDTLTLEVGGRKQLKTDDGVVYDTYASENESVAAVNSVGVVTALSTGTAKIYAEVGGGTKIYCEVTVVEKSDEDEIADYHIDVVSKQTLKVGSTQVIDAIVKKDGTVSSAVAKWIIPETDVAEFTPDGNSLTVKGLKNGKVTVSVTKSNFTANVTIKCYDDAHVLATPEFSYADGKIVWNADANADGYRVTVNGGKDWAKLGGDVTEYAVDGAFIRINVCVVATASFESDYVDAVGVLPYSYEPSAADVKASLSECGAVTGAEEFGVTPSGESGRFGKTIINIYGTSGALLDNGKTSALSDLSVVFFVKSAASGKITFVSEDDKGNLSVSEFTVTEEWREVGYKLNSYVDKCYAAIDGDSVDVKGLYISKTSDYAYSSKYKGIVESASSKEAFEQKMLADYVYLSVVEREAVTKKYSAQINAFLTEFLTEDKPTGLKFLGGDFKLSHMTDAKDNSGTAVSAVLLSDPETGTSLAIKFNGTYRYYKTAMPAEEPSCDYIVWRIYNAASSAITLERIGTLTKVELQPGWNSVKFTIAQFFRETWAPKNFYSESGAYGTIRLGSVCAVKIEERVKLTFIGKEMSAADFGAEASVVSITDEVVGTIKAIALHDKARSYASLLPSEEPAFDYYEWRIYNAGDADTIRIGNKADIPLAKGWNTVTLTWANLQAGGAVKNFYKNGGYYPRLYVGSLIGRNN